MTAFDWRRAAPDEVDRQYSPSRFARKPLDAHLADYAARSAGVDPATLLVPGRPLLVYVHGGYWQRLSAADSRFLADDARRRGVSLHAVDYTLAPAATIPRMVEECIVDVVAIAARLAPPRVVVAGCSAGAHLAAMCARDPRLAGRVQGYALLSGIYDLRPLVVTPTNDPLGLDDASAAAISPLLLAPETGGARVLCAAAEHDPPEFVRQNAAYADRLRAAGTRVDAAVVGGRDHFDLPYDLLDDRTEVGGWTLELLGGGAR